MRSYLVQRTAADTPQADGRNTADGRMDEHEDVSVIEPKLAFVVATKDRPQPLRRMLKSLSEQSRVPDRVVIIDASESPNPDITDLYPDLEIMYIHHHPPNISRQRNLGVKKAEVDNGLIGFLDDDIELLPDAVENMLTFWASGTEDVGGAAFNMLNHPRPVAGSLKRLPLVEELGLYSRKRGAVLSSGFQTMIGKVGEDRYVSWLPTTAVVWRNHIFENFRMDERLSGFSYLEDLDFSYRVGKSYRLLVLADACYYHYPDLDKNWDDYGFGKKEVFNRIYFVNKFREFSLPKCYLGLSVRALINLVSFFRERRTKWIKRAFGNSVGLARTVFYVLTGGKLDDIPGW